MTEPYYADDQVKLYLGDSRVVTDWLAADVLVTDPPYGIAWASGSMSHAWHKRREPRAIANDSDTNARDAVLALWGDRPAAVFGDLRQAIPHGTKQVLIYEKPGDAGTTSCLAGFRRDAEAIYLLGPWPRTHGGRSSILRTGSRTVGNPSGPAGRYGHPHTKPVDVMAQLIDRCPPGVIADPFAGSGSTLVAAKQLGRKAIGVEIEERYCEMAARRLAQDPLPHLTHPVHTLPPSPDGAAQYDARRIGEGQER